MNRLSKEKAPYLRHSAYQKIDWYPWSEEAFEKARQEDKPVFLSSGAIWCHWCHVMAKECFEDEEIVRLLNENFINIKLDRDERPDIDRRYQQAVAAMGSGGGWPLSVFLTPDKKPFFGGTYFPPEDSFGRPGFKRVLKEVTEIYKSKKKEIHEYSNKLTEFLKSKPPPPGEINESLIDSAVAGILSHFDPQNGGFGSSPKFPLSGVIEFLLNRFFFTGKESFAFPVRKTLESMAKGGFHDQLGGGFHRYSVDASWIVPHFEKLADDNAWLLRNYVDAFCLFGYGYFREVAEGIIDFTVRTLSDPNGGFYASQDADVTPEDEGGYFTWTDEDFKRILKDDEYKVLSLHLLHEKGAMHHYPNKRVLFVSRDAGEIVRETNLDIQTVTSIIKHGKRKLLEERNKRKTPFIDRTFYTSLNGMMISAYLKAYRRLKIDKLRDFALISIERIMNNHFRNDQLFHTKGIKALLDDYVYFIDALIAAYEITASKKYLDSALVLMELCIQKFWDKVNGGFFDTDTDLVGIRFKAIEDIPHPSPNSVGIMLLLKLFYITEKKGYRLHAGEALENFSLKAKESAINTAYYFCALDAYYNMLKLTLQTVPSSALAEAAIFSFYPYMSLVYGEDRGLAIPCRKEICYEPIDDSETLREFMSGHQKVEF
ncbi:MAG: thioredoxin domain-containing protein [Nitrospirota bacterium]